MNPLTSKKIDSLCTQFSLYKSVNQPTHFTETSSSIIDILLVSNKDNLILSGVGDPFLGQELRYHCPIYGIFKLSKTKVHSFMRHIWSYDHADFNLLRSKAESIDWTSLQDDDINVYANNINKTINNIASECIPNRYVRIRPSDPPWITSEIKRNIRKRKRAFRRAKRTDADSHWETVRKLRNNAVNSIRHSKRSYFDSIAGKLKSQTLSAKDWWSTLKMFIAPNSKSSISPLEINGNIVTDERDKSNVLNNFFQSQTLLNDQDAILPDLPPSTVQTHLQNIVLTPSEVELVLETLSIGKAAGPNGLNNRIIRALSHELSYPFCSLFNQSLQTGVVQTSYKEANVCPVPKKGDLSMMSSYRPISLLNAEHKVFERLIFKYLFNHLQDNNLLSSLQSGFIPGDSTINQLTFLYYNNTFCQALNAGKEVRAVFCDISKAFDRV